MIKRDESRPSCHISQRDRPNTNGSRIIAIAVHRDDLPELTSRQHMHCLAPHGRCNQPIKRNRRAATLQVTKSKTAHLERKALCQLCLEQQANSSVATLIRKRASYFRYS